VFSIILILIPWMKQKFLYSIHHKEIISCVLRGKLWSSNISLITHKTNSCMSCCIPKGASQYHALVTKEFWSLHAIFCPCIQAKPKARIVCNKRLPCILYTAK
jgi:hypothetical protein